MSAGVVPASTRSPWGVGTTDWQASYSGDATNAAADLDVSSLCRCETRPVRNVIYLCSTLLYADPRKDPSVSVPLDTALICTARRFSGTKGHCRGNGDLHTFTRERRTLT